MSDENNDLKDAIAVFTAPVITSAILGAAKWAGVLHSDMFWVLSPIMLVAALTASAGVSMFYMWVMRK